MNPQPPPLDMVFSCASYEQTYTSYSNFKGGEWKEIDVILDQVAGYGVSHVTVTGGEPLAQRECGELLSRLCDSGYQVSLETSGALDISAVDPRVERVVDLKTPGLEFLAHGLHPGGLVLAVASPTRQEHDYRCPSTIARARDRLAIGGAGGLKVVQRPLLQA